ncbi:MAG: hypothetical protein RR879_05530 [Hydrogenoanaerobacterium sp.]
MDDMISRLIDMDKKAQATVKAAEEKRDEMKAAIAGEKEKPWLVCITLPVVDLDPLG